MSTTAGGSIHATPMAEARAMDWTALRAVTYRRKLQLALGLIWLGVGK